MEVETQPLLSHPVSVSLHQPRPTALKRHATPPPRAKTAEEKKASEARESADEDEESSAECEPELPEYTGKLILGFHPQAFMAILAINAFFVICAIGAGPGRQYIASAMTTLAATWKTASSPFEKFLVGWADFIVAGVALLGLSPLVATIAIAFLRAAMDLRHAPLWQKCLLLALVTAALATVGIFRERVFWLIEYLKAWWDSISDPLEKFLIDYADYMIGGAALFCLVPLGLALLSYALSAVWNCRVKLVVEHVEPGSADDASPKKKDA